MKAIVLAAVMAIFYFVAITTAFLLASPDIRKARLMVLLFGSSLPLAAALHYLTPADLGFLPASWCESDRLMDLAFFLFIYSATFFGFILQLYNLADRGFSLRIVIDIDQSLERYMTIDQVMTSYSAGRGIGWMYQKRIDDLAKLELIRVNGGIAAITPSGQRVASRFFRLRRFLRIVG